MEKIKERMGSIAHMEVTKKTKRAREFLGNNNENLALNAYEIYARKVHTNGICSLCACGNAY